MGLAAITAIGWGQSQRDINGYPLTNSRYDPPYAPVVATFADKDFKIDPLDDLKYGSMYLVKASNNNYMSIFTGVLGYGALAASYVTPTQDGSGVFGVVLISISTALKITSIVQERKGLERLYLGMNGITIKLN